MSPMIRFAISYFFDIATTNRNCFSRNKMKNEEMLMGYDHQYALVNNFSLKNQLHDVNDITYYCLCILLVVLTA